MAHLAGLAALEQVGGVLRELLKATFVGEAHFSPGVCRRVEPSACLLGQFTDFPIALYGIGALTDEQIFNAKLIVRKPLDELQFALIE